LRVVAIMLEGSHGLATRHRRSIRRVSAYLLVFGYAAGASWALHEQRMGYGASNNSKGAAVEPGDVFLPYVTKGCWGWSGSRQQQVLIGRAVVLTGAKALAEPVRLGEGRKIDTACELFFEQLAPYGEGVALAPLAPSLDVFRESPYWTNKLRRPVLRLGDADAERITAALKAVTSAYDDTIGSYPRAHLP